ncbi:type II toxin-antitoxin system ParD family antitoxin [Methylocystis hirsuta]|uniref:Type II toxin-antitoxin system ParD family antitoxin n=1 Tax=Methylocystis hirsuta TaxID=369798 RepID=A0A3M9XIY1_9HYPH|nr:type II toxin-antitoxin system ParD family antitoxin [Methylocystis hirsuta]RNJ48117.1 type II toxin-antitoxin system ParD family antitoxin [Methylocystis hirsuta]
MSNIQKVSIALSPEFLALIREAIETGEYTSTSEVVRDALRDWKQRRALRELDAEELRRLWQEGIEGGAAVEATPVFKRLRGKYQRLAVSKI